MCARVRANIHSPTSSVLLPLTQAHGGPTATYENDNVTMTASSTPTDLGAPTQFDSWRPNQREALDSALDPWTRFVGISASTGSGKSLSIFLTAHLLTKSGGRAVILTSRVGLGHQYASAFPGLAEVHGRRNYQSDASYGRAIQQACDANIVVTNYAFWLHAQNEGSDRLGTFDVMLCDEAVEAFSDLSNYYSMEIEEKELLRLAKVRLPDYGEEELSEWAGWASETARRLRIERKLVSGIDSGEKMIDGGEYTLPISSMERVADMTGQWVCEREGKKVRLAKVWPGEHAERVLFRGIPKVVLMSATLRPRSLELLGLQSGGFRFVEYPHPFPWSLRPVYWVPTIQARQKTASDAHWEMWAMRIDQIIEKGMDSLCVIHTVSYARAKMFMEKSRNRHIRGLFQTHSSYNTAAVVARFLNSQPPAVLVSPSLISGWDMPQVSVAVIGKVPWGDSRGKLEQARIKADKTYSAYETGQKLVQTCGRHVRGSKPEDFGITFIIDDSITWSMKAFRGLIPDWFVVQKSDTIPDWKKPE